MSMPRAGRFLFCIAAVVLVVVPPAGVAGHTRGVRPGRAAGRPFPENATRAEELERLFMRWVRYVGGLKHSTFHHAPLARAFPSYSLVVDKDPAAGDFTSVQAAVDSLPTINLVRVVIKGEGDDIVDARVHHPGGRRRGQDDRAVGGHGGHARRAEGAPARHVRVRVVRRERAVLHRQEHHLQEHGAGAERGGDGEAGGGAAGVGGQRGVRGVPVPGRAGHALRPVGAPLLQGLLHRGVHRLHLRQRALPLRGLPRARDRAGLRGADGAEPAEHAGGHGVLVRRLQGDGVGGALPGPGLGHLLPRRLRLHLHGRHHRPARLVQLGRPQPRADGVLRAVQVHGPRRQLLRQGVLVAGAHRRGGQALHLPQLHRRHRVDQDLTGAAFDVVTRTHLVM
uniref:Uncharacterized protein n=1 Tax=Triticum urartu TaxID=4572 RepID=A0A8R7PA81_TRIUA